VLWREGSEGVARLRRECDEMVRPRSTRNGTNAQIKKGKIGELYT